ncbi:hypothetical protein [Paraburkholderia antibiotica]|uniref:DUF1579 domain-containing protein n=1 Tax=Paraburkholderia antibiotica TaxID=2728839 RepID=A0A7Y0A1N4_9BURK|nr:hypothetical protein [Paraburkholderia antibiotica]NML34814.1 hypothetical protein [Paraburkholderia antibiotica]
MNLLANVPVNAPENGFASHVENAPATGFLAALHAPARAADIATDDDLYGWLIGSWDMDVVHYRTDLRACPRRGEIHFGWVLEGRAVQDVWIMPPQAGSSDAMYGTTLRVWDATAALWRVTYLNPRTGQRDELTGRWIGAQLVQIGRHADGTPIRWNFTDITSDSFCWSGVALEADGLTWRLEAEFHARRRAARAR